MNTDYDIVDALESLAEDMHDNGELVERFSVRVAALRKERDEALKKAKEWEALWSAEIDHANRYKRERDEARADLGEALDELAYIREEYANGDPVKLSADALLLKNKVITLDYNRVQNELEKFKGEHEKMKNRLLWIVNDTEGDDIYWGVVRTLEELGIKV